MTERTTPPLDEIRGLLAERERFETWLRTLEARRSATPAHVFDRVWQDYDARRARVDETLSGHAAGLQGAADTLAERHGQLTRTLGERRDALAEVELRALVGEYDEAQGGELRAEAVGAIETLDREAGALDGELSEVRAVLGQVRGPVAAPPSAPLAQEPPVTTGAVAGPGAEGDRAEHQDDPPVVPVVAGDAREERAAPTPGAERSFERGGIAGLGDARGAPVLAGQGLASSALGTAAVDDSGDARFGTSTQKTLRCPECSAMNFPTEWYCERCGGELAAM